MKRGSTVLLVMMIMVLCGGSAKAGPVEVSGGLNISGEAGTDGVRFPDGTTQRSAVEGGQYQKRITATCSTGYAMRSVDSTGGVLECQAVGSGTVTNIETGAGLTGGPINSTGTISLSVPVSVTNGGTGSGSGSITGTGSLTFTAGGTNTNVNLVPNGTGTVDVASKRITNLATPTASTDASTKGYVDAVVPSGFMIMGSSATPPSGYTYTGMTSVDTWMTKASMPTARRLLATAAVNNVIYAIGGYDGSSYLSTNQAYDPATNSWTTKATMPTARAALAAVAVNQKIYSIGGYTKSGMIYSYISKNEEYDPVANSWTTKTAMPTARAWLGAAAYDMYVMGIYTGSFIYTIGGNNNSPLTTNEVFNISGNTWSVGAAMPTARDSLAAVNVNDVIYAIGGNNGSYLSTNQAYDIAADSWTTKASMPTARGSLATAAVNNVIYAIGGYNGSSYLSTNQAYDTAADSWTTKASMPTARSGHAAANVNNVIYAIGGYNGASYLTTNEAYNPDRKLYVFTKD